MDEEKRHNNPKKIFKEEDNLVVLGNDPPSAEQKLASIRRSEITSTAPDDINLDKIYVGKQHGLHSTRREIDSRKRGATD